MYLAKVVITLRKSILDPQGKAVRHALESLSLGSVKDVRMGKFVELRIDAVTEQEANRAAEEACKKLLANPVMEDFTYSLEKLS